MDADVARRLLFTGMGLDSLRKRIERTTLEFTNTQRTRQQPRQAARVHLATSKLGEERDDYAEADSSYGAVQVNKTDDKNNCIIADGV